MGIFSRSPSGPEVNVVASRDEFNIWLRAQPAGRYYNVHNEDCARGLVHLHPPAKFIVLPSANFSVQLYLHSCGFDVPRPKPQVTEREKQVGEWKEKIARYLASSVGSEQACAPAAETEKVEVHSARPATVAPPPLIELEPEATPSPSSSRAWLRLLAAISIAIFLVIATNGGIFLVAAAIVSVAFAAALIFAASSGIAEHTIGPGHGGSWKSVLLGMAIFLLGIILVFRGCHLGGGDFSDDFPSTRIDSPP